jgi:hypothetical protein
MANVTEFLKRVTMQALEARDNGDTTALNTLTAHPAVRDYVNNVVFMGSMTPQQFEYWNKDKMRAIESLAEQYEQAEQDKERIDTLESKLDKMSKMLEALVEVQTAKQQKAVAEAVEDTATDDDTEKKPDDPGDDDNAETDEEGEDRRADDAQEETAEDNGED